jgi:bifunctional isochorismate lyase / aryl carrier protein
VKLDDLPTHMARGASALHRAHIAPYPAPTSECLALNKVRWTLDPNDCVLLVHDAQNFWLDMFVDPAPLLAKLVVLREASAKLGIPVVYTVAERPKTLAERGLAMQLWGPGIGGGKPTAEQVAIHTQLSPGPEDHIIVKSRISAFHETGLEALLRRMNRRQVLLCGMFGHHGVLLTAAAAYMYNYQLFLAADAIGDYSQADHDMTIRYVAEMCGQLVLSDQVLESLAPRATTTGGLS